jgi:hypothetical protein
MTPLEKLTICARVMNHGTFENRYRLNRYVVGHNPVIAALCAAFERLYYGV